MAVVILVARFKISTFENLNDQWLATPRLQDVSQLDLQKATA